MLMEVYELIISVNQIGEKLSDDICSNRDGSRRPESFFFSDFQN